MEYLILRNKRAGQPFNSSTRIPAASGSGEVQVICQDLPPSEIAGLERDKDVLGATASMPIALDEPISTENAASKQPGNQPCDNQSGPTWGVRAVQADTSGFTGRGVRVAVLDTGIDTEHEAFCGVNFTGRNFTPHSDTDPTIDPDAFADSNGHGTHCAGTILGRPIDGIRIGVAPGIDDLIVGKVLGTVGSTTGTIYQAINWALEMGAQIVSMSLSMDLVGYTEDLIESGFHPKEATSRAMKLLIDNVRFFDKFGNLLRTENAFGRSAVIIAAAGNQSNRRGQRFSDSAYVQNANYPANAEDFLSVGAVGKLNSADCDFQIADFSNAGADFAAPGVDVLSAAAGPDKQALRMDSGTSMAAPHVAGVAALWAQKLMLNGQASTRRVVDSLFGSADTLSKLEEVGRGIPLAPQT